MDVTRCATAREFLDATAALRASDPVRTNLLGSVAESVESHERTYEECYWWIVRDRDAVVGLAMRTVPHAMIIGPTPIGAVGALAAKVVVADPSLPAVSANSRAIDAFIGGAGAVGWFRSGRVVRHELLQSINELMLPKVKGKLRVATDADTELVMTWGRAFTEELDLEAMSEEGIRSRLKAGAVLLWSRKGETVSMAAHAPAVRSGDESVARVGPVYTPPEHRGHGYAAAVTAAVTELLLAEGNHVMLYSDKANAVSNGVYRRLGYQIVDEVVRYEFEGTGVN